MGAFFKTNTQVSEPTDSSQFNLSHNFNGFGWDVDQGMFIPVDEAIDYYQDPYPKIQVRKLPNG